MVINLPIAFWKFKTCGSIIDDAFRYQGQIIQLQALPANIDGEGGSTLVLVAGIVPGDRQFFRVRNQGQLC